MYKFPCYSGILSFPRILAFSSQTIKIITTFTFTFLITHFNFTQLLFWILALLDLSFSIAIKNLFCIHFVHCHLHIPCFLCLFTCPTHSCTYSYSPNFHLCMISSLFLFFHNYIQVSCPIISQVRTISQSLLCSMLAVSMLKYGVLINQPYS